MIHVELKGLAEAMRALEPRVLNGPLRRFFKKAAIVVQAEVRPRAPVDAGQLKNAVDYEVDSHEPPLFAKVGILDAHEGSPLWFKARAMEYGTGSAGDPEVSHKDRHFPPSGALDRWAARHGGGGGFAVALAIARRGGLEPRRYLREGADAAFPDVERAADGLQDDIRAEFDKS